MKYLLQIACLAVMTVAFIKSYNASKGNILAWVYALAATMLVAILGA